MPRQSLPDAFTGMVVNGKLVQPTIKSSFAKEEVPTATEARQLVASTRRKLADLPALPRQLNTFSALLVYTASGLTDAEIALALGFDVKQIVELRKHEAYQQLQNYMIEAVKEQAGSEVQEILAHGVVNAANKVVTLVDSADEKVALAASKDLLDRNGHTAAQKIDIRAQMDSTFRIEVIDKRNDIVPVIDMESDNG